MERDVFSHSYDQWDLCLDGFFNGLCCLVSGYVDGRSIWFCFLLGLYELNKHTIPLTR